MRYGVVMPVILLFLTGAGTVYANSPLHQAAYKGNLDDARKLIRKGAEVNARDSEGKTPLFHSLYLAKYYGQASKKEVARLLIENDASVNIKDRKGQTPLMEALSYGNTLIAGLLIENGADVTVTDDTGSTPLHRAAGRVGVDLVNTLIRKGADVNARDRAGWTPLHEAVEMNNTQAAVLLISRGTRINIATEDGNTPLHIAVIEGNLKIISLLVKRGADVNLKNIYGEAPLHLASRKKTGAAAGALISGGADINLADNNGLAPLHKAVLYGSRDLVTLYIKNGADVSTRSVFGVTPLHIAVRKGDWNVARLLLKAGADPNIASEKQRGGNTPLHIASRSGNLPMVRLLMEHGARDEIENAEKLKPEVVAMQTGQMAAARYLQSVEKREEKTEETIHRGPAPETNRVYASSYLRIRSEPDRFIPERAFDNDLETAWVEGRRDNGEGETLSFRIEGKIRKIALLPGYGKTDRHYLMNNRLKKAKLYIYRAECDNDGRCEGYRQGGLVKEVDLQFQDRRAMQKFSVRVRRKSRHGYIGVIEIRDVYQGSRWADTCISEIEIIN